jgi:hypothetical protein
MYIRSERVPPEFEGDDEGMDLQVKMLLKLAELAGWKPTGSREAIRKTVKCCVTNWGDGWRIWVGNERVDRDLESLVVAWRRALPDLPKHGTYGDGKTIVEFFSGEDSGVLVVELLIQRVAQDLSSDGGITAHPKS